MSPSPDLISSPVRSREYRRRKKKTKSRDQISHQNPSTFQNNNFSWKSENTEQAYSSKLLQALKKVRQTSPARSRGVREAADRALAVAARGRTRWSRAILTSRLKLKFMKNRRLRGAAAPSYASRRTAARKPRLGILRLKGKNNLPAVQRKVRVLGRLVPGCRKEALPVILEEATDYISALEMQVRAMTALAQLLALPGSSGVAPGSSAGN